jgi:hypothetical protein
MKSGSTVASLPDGFTATTRHIRMSAPEQPPTRPVQVKLVLLGTSSLTRSVLESAGGREQRLRAPPFSSASSSWGCPRSAAVQAGGQIASSVLSQDLWSGTLH